MSIANIYADSNHSHSIAIYPICALKDNYIWAIVNKAVNEAILVDVGECLPALTFLQDNQLSLSAIWITHHHDDHIGGVGELLSHYPSAKLYAHSTHKVDKYRPIIVDDATQFQAFGYDVRVWATGGHTDSHLSYLLDLPNVASDNISDNSESITTHVFCGDTLFRAGCGRVFTGTIEQLYHSFLKYHQLSDHSIFYPAHEYTLANLAFALTIEPNNSAIQSALTTAKNQRNNNQPTLPTTLGDERAINPFLRAISDFDTLKTAYLQAISLNNININNLDDNLQTPIDSQTLFAQLRQLKDNF